MLRSETLDDLDGGKSQRIAPINHLARRMLKNGESCVVAPVRDEVARFARIYRWSCMSVYDRDDLVQEVLLALWLTRPTHNTTYPVKMDKKVKCPGRDFQRD